MSTALRSLFERAPDASCPRGRMLLFSYHFPPGQAAGVLRWQKLAAFAFEHGLGLDVFTVHPDSLAGHDDSRFADLPEGIRVFGVLQDPLPVQRVERWLARTLRRLRALRASAVEGASSPSGKRAATPMPTSFACDELEFDPTSYRSWLRAYEVYLDYASFGAWARGAYRAALRVVDERHRFVASCGPPHMSHVWAAKLAGRAGVPLVVDMRDPWSQGERVQESIASPLWLWLARRYEKRVVRASSLVVMNTEPARRNLQSLFPDRADRIVAVPNGCDEQPLPVVERDRRFLIAYAGTVYLDRTPLTLFRAAAQLIRERSLTPDDFAIEFMGNILDLDGETIADIAAREGLDGYVHTHPAGRYEEAEAFLAGAAMVVSLPQDSHLAIPSKVYEYMRYEARVLVLAERDSATEELLRGSRADVVDPADEAAALAVLRDAYQRHVDGECPAPLAHDARFTRRTRAAELFAAIDEIALGASNPPTR